METIEAKTALEQMVLKCGRAIPLNRGGMFKTRMDNNGIEHPMEWISYLNCTHCSEDRTACMYGIWTIPQEVTWSFPTRGDEDVALEISRFIDKANSLRTIRAAKKGVSPKLLNEPEFIGDFDALWHEKNALYQRREALKLAGKWVEFYEAAADSALLEYRAELYRVRRESCGWWEVVPRRDLKTGKPYKEYIHHACAMHSFFVAQNTMLKHIMQATLEPDALDAFVRAFYIRPKYEMDYDIGDAQRGWTYENTRNVEYRVRKRAQAIQRQNKFRKRTSAT